MTSITITSSYLLPRGGVAECRNRHTVCGFVSSFFVLSVVFAVMAKRRRPAPRAVQQAAARALQRRWRHRQLVRSVRRANIARMRPVFRRRTYAIRRATIQHPSFIRRMALRRAPLPRYYIRRAPPRLARRFGRTFRAGSAMRRRR